MNLGAATVLAAGISGCASLGEERRREEMQEREDKLLMQENMQKLNTKVQLLEAEIQKIEGDLQSLRETQARSSQAQEQAFQSRLADIEAARNKDKKEIIDTVGDTISKVVGSSSASARKQTKRSASDKGYEHVVQSGESLSAIAQAYGVTTRLIIENNDIKDPNRLSVGQKLFIPQ